MSEENIANEDKIEVSNRDSKGRFKKGFSGNRKGRPPGKTLCRTMREKVNPYAEELIDRLVQMAIGGDMSAMKILFDKGIPKFNFNVNEELRECDTLTEKMEGLWDYAANGDMSPDEFKDFASGLSSLSKARQSDELEAEIEAIKKIMKERNGEK